eukprot:TRINITY_DN50783_c0_g1_i1.p2 TRINITY_DN50783_c0_g1~~TRINITY_DN50783_c0_g1_i1.p2  ORF type:complete len:134 (-),score=34.64 TRINITY_DN50783_c0_g1_i1:65-466(-)
MSESPTSPKRPTIRDMKLAELTWRMRRLGGPHGTECKGYERKVTASFERRREAAEKEIKELLGDLPLPPEPDPKALEAELAIACKNLEWELACSTTYEEGQGEKQDDLREQLAVAHHDFMVSIGMGQEFGEGG